MRDHRASTEQSSMSEQRPNSVMGGNMKTPTTWDGEAGCGAFCKATLPATAHRPRRLPYNGSSQHSASAKQHGTIGHQAGIYSPASR